MTRAKTLRVEQVALSAMRPAPWNPRTITEFELESLKESLAKFGAVEPIVLNADGLILGGHQRFAAAEALGWTSFPAIRVELADANAERLLNLALNRISGEWDTTKLATLIDEMALDPDAYRVAGFGSDEVTRLLMTLNTAPPPEFPSPNEDVDHRCPSCGYEWSGPPA